MQKVFDNQMVAHVWAQQKQSEGRSANGNYFFADHALYSYGQHFLVGFIMPDGVALLNSDSHSVSTNKHKAYAWQAVRGRSFSIPYLTRIDHALNWLANGEKDTSGRIARHVAEHALTIDVDAGAYLLSLIGTRNPDKAFERIKAKAAKAESEHKAKAAKVKKDKQLALAKFVFDRGAKIVLCETLQRYEGVGRWNIDREVSGDSKRFYHAHRAAKKAKRTRHAAAVWCVLKGVRAYAARLESNREGLLRRQNKARVIREVRGRFAALRNGERLSPSALVELAKSLNYLVLSRSDDSPLAIRLKALAKHAGDAADAAREVEHAERLAKAESDLRAWLHGESMSYFRASDDSGGAFIRATGVERDDSGEIIDGTLETSHGAKVPLAHAVRLFKFLKRVRDRGANWYANGHTIRVGHFRVDSIDAHGNFVAGCHRIHWPETERLARELDVFDATPDDSALENKHAAA